MKESSPIPIDTGAENKIIPNIARANTLVDLELNVPTVLRDSRGRVRWRLPGNTPEQNEQLGIANVQGLFLERFPGFNDLFPREEDGKIADDKREEAKRFILDRMRSQKISAEQLRSSAWNINSTPYFAGRYQVALQRSFSPWGLDIDPQIDAPQKPKGYWTPKTIEQEAKEFYEQEGGLSQRLLNNKGRKDLTNAIHKYYPEGLSALRKKFGIIVINRPKGYWTPQEIERQAMLFLKDYGELTFSMLRSQNRKDLESAISKSYPGQITALRDKLKIGKGVHRKPNGHWTPEQIEKEAFEFYKTEGELTQTTLNKKKRGDLSRAIQLYPGQMAKLKERLGIIAISKPKGYWTPQVIEQQAELFFKNHGVLSFSMLHSQNRKDLANAISHHYPGRMTALKQKFGIQLKDQEATISPYEPNEELMRFLEVKDE